MHELSLACSLVEEAERVLDAENADRAVCVTVGVGRLSGIDPGAFEFAFPLAAAGTRLAGAKLVLHDRPVRVRCRACGRESSPDFPHRSCVLCSADDVDLISGHELMIESMEVE
jgi:hydrogenase nickel incorporation protein HypA/HybF